MNETKSENSWRPQILVALALGVSFPLRVWPFGRLGFNQFDEGIYGMAASWVFARSGIASIDPSLIPYAPPGYPILVGASYWLFGLSDQAAILVSATLGSMSVPVVAWISARLFGLRAGVISAWCICFSGPHIAFSRMALTDSSFLFVWLLGFAASLRFLEKPNVSRALAVGILVGLAQQLKYNGWLLGGLVIVTWITGLVRSNRVGAWTEWVRLGGWGGLAILISAIIVFPWFSFVETHGGYDALLRHQRSYLGNWSSWWPHLRIQVNQAVVLAGPLWLCVVTGTVVAISLRLVSARDTVEGRFQWIRSLGSAGLVSLLLAAPLTTGFVVIPGLLRKSKLTDRLLGVSWVGLLILSPYYHPYARLWLPFEALHWIILGGLAVRLTGEMTSSYWVGPTRRCTVPSLWPVALLGLGSLAAGPGFPVASPGRFGHEGLFDPSDSLRSLATTIGGRIPPDVRSLRTLVRPALSFYLTGRIGRFPQSGLESFQSNHDPSQWGLIDSAILSNPLGRIDQPDRRSSLQPLLDHWELVEEFPAMTSIPTVLDLDPSNPGRPRAESYACFWLIRLRTPSTSP